MIDYKDTGLPDHSILRVAFDNLLRAEANNIKARHLETAVDSIMHVQKLADLKLSTDPEVMSAALLMLPYQFHGAEVFNNMPYRVSGFVKDAARIPPETRGGRVLALVNAFETLRKLNNDWDEIKTMPANQSHNWWLHEDAVLKLQELHQASPDILTVEADERIRRLLQKGATCIATQVPAGNGLELPAPTA